MPAACHLPAAASNQHIPATEPIQHLAPSLAHTGIRCTTSWSTSWQLWHRSHPPLQRSCLPIYLARLGRLFWREQPPGIGLWLPGWMLLSFLPWNFPSCFKSPRQNGPCCAIFCPRLLYEPQASGKRHPPAAPARLSCWCGRMQMAGGACASGSAASAAKGASAQRGSIRALSTSHISTSALPGVQHKHAPWFETRFAFPHATPYPACHSACTS